MFYKVLSVGIIVLLALFVLGMGKKDLPVKVGDKAPDFKLKDQNGKVRSLSEFRGKNVVLYFYPKDETPGCTAEACSFRDGYGKLQDAGIVILGVSYDSPASHRKFIAKYDLPFTLLSDENKEVSELYGADGPLVARRYTYLINPEGKIVHIFKKVDVYSHADEVLAAFQAR